MMRRVALITGITGQDGSYLAELLLSKGYEVHGIMRRSSSFNTGRIDHIFDQITLHYGDVTDGSCMLNILSKHWPNEIYHLAAQSHVKVSFEIPEYTAIADGLGILKILEAVRSINEIDDGRKMPRIYNACTSEMYGTNYLIGKAQNEHTGFAPASPYGSAKLYSYWIARNYRDAYNMHISNGILFNHESPRRGSTFVTQKIVKGAVAILTGKQECLFLGNVDAVRDWGHAKDYVEGMWRMLQQDIGDDYVLATGVPKTVRDVVEYVFKKLHNPITWDSKILGSTMGMQGVVRCELSKFFRPNEVPYLCGDATKARVMLKWEPKYTFETLLDDMIEAELKNTVYGGT